VPLFLLKNWKWLLPTAAAAFLGTMLMFTKLELSDLKLAVAEQKTEAAQLLATATAASAAIDAARAEFANKLDTEHALSAANDAARRADFDKRLREARRGASNRCPTAVAAVDPGERAGVAESGDDGSGNIDPASHLRDAALELQRYAVSCHSWATQVGR